MAKQKLASVQGTRWAFMQRFDIPDAADQTRIYLRRYRIIQTPWFAFYLHFIYQPDNDRDLHNHPWSFISLVVRGGYHEKVLPVATDSSVEHYYTWGLGSWHRMGRGSAHRIMTLKPGTITFVICGPRRGNWGFFTDHGYVEWQDYNREKYGTIMPEVLGGPA